MKQRPGKYWLLGGALLVLGLVALIIALREVANRHQQRGNPRAHRRLHTERGEAVSADEANLQEVRVWSSKGWLRSPRSVQSAIRKMVRPILTAVGLTEPVFQFDVIDNLKLE